ncbi:aldolase [Paenibacillus sp. LMG 31456]|uniref:Aldolase n=1 Tax=Paenibacillus foliorum TaxID=2654974 RepID=A0A972K102_9BACL|nr:aldolase [Paenibacillus foliorum]NOU92242.1 aldolase [Paenibacillus foliorum]
MIEHQINRVYRAFGLNMLSEIRLPELIDQTGQDLRIDVVIEFADLTRDWEERGGEGQQFVVYDNNVMFRIDQAALFLIQDGKRIIISPMMDYDEDRIRLYLLGSCMGALLLQRAILPLHGSAIVIDGKAFGFVGQSGAGKSTLASAFLQRGYQLLSDDVIAVSFSHDNTPYVTPAYPQQKLWQESLTNLGMNSEDYRPILNRLTKYAIPVPHLFFKHTLPLAAVFEIVTSDNEASGLYQIEDILRLQTLYTHTFRKKLIEPLGLMEWHFNNSVKLANGIDIYRLVRDASGLSASDMVSLILNTIREEAVR